MYVLFCSVYVSDCTCRQYVKGGFIVKFLPFQSVGRFYCQVYSISVGKTDVVDISLIKNKAKHHFVSKIFYYQIL